MRPPHRTHRSASARRRQALRGALASAVLVAGCGGGEPLPPGFVQVATRLIPEDPQELLVPARLVESEARWRWGFETAADLAPWIVEGDLATSGLAPGGGLRLEAREGGATLIREVSFDAGEVDALELEIRQLRRGGVILEWAGPGEGFSPERRLEVGLGVRRGGKGRLYRLSLLGHPGWRGPVARLRFTLDLPRATQVTVGEIRGVGETLAAERLAAALARPWKVGLDHDVRNAWPAVPGLPLVREVEVPRQNPSLAFAYGVQETVDRGVTFRVSAGAGAEAPVLFEERLAPGEGGWREARVDLARWAGERLELRFETAAAEGFDPRLGFALWGHPEVLGAPGRRAGAPLNVLLVSIDTLRADHLSLYGYGRPTSPHLDAWARERAAVFETAVAAAPWTLPGHVSLFTGLDAHHHGVNHTSAAPGSLLFLAEALRDRGYETVALTGGGYVHPQWGFAQGFDRFHYYDDQMGFGEELDTGLERALGFLESAADRPFFLFFHTYEVHNPYRHREPYFERFSAHDSHLWLRLDRPERLVEDGFLDRRSFTLMRRGEVLSEGSLPPEYADLPADGYDAGIAYTDAHLGRLLQELDALDLARRTIVVVTSDHGEMLGEHGVYNHLYLYDENLLIPLVIADPRGRGAGRRVAGQVRQVDVLPTVLELAGIEPPPGIDGVSLVARMEGEEGGVPREAWSYAPASNYGISLRLDGRFKYVGRNDPWPSTGPAERLHDLERDPGEAGSAGDTGREVEGLHRRVEEALQAVPGLRIRLSNAGPGSLEGSLGGGAVSPSTLKAVAVGCRCLEWTAEGRAHFLLAAGESRLLAVEDVKGDRLLLRLAYRAPGEPSPREIAAAVDLAALTAPLAVALGPSGWEQGPAAAAGGVATGATLRWQGQAGVGTDPMAGDDAELERQLRALGYVQ